MSYSEAISSDKLAVAVECEEMVLLCLTVSNRALQRSTLGIHSDLENQFSKDLMDAIGQNLMSLFLVSYIRSPIEHIFLCLQGLSIRSET